MRAIVIGAGPAGLAAAACLVRQGVETRILERSDAVGSSWRNHYGRLHLHTARGRSGLPHHPMPDRYGQYPSRTDMIEYLEDYAAHFGLEPQFGVSVAAVRPAEAGWVVHHSGGEDRADAVVFATGLNGTPFRAELPGIDGFSGRVLHSSDYDAPDDLTPGRVLVVGFGNSGGEIALDLAEAGAEVTLSVRGPVNILPKEIFGLPITSMGLLRKIFSYRVADAITAPVLRAKIGRPEDYGLQSAGKGPAAQVIEDGRIPLIDIGTLGAIRDGKITVRPGVDRIDGDTVHFVDGETGAFDAILLATGYRVDLRAMLPDTPQVLSAAGKPLVSGGESGAPGLFFCSYKASAEGQLRQSGMEAEEIARLVGTQGGV
ncbi:flavin-containing monooxygenase [Phaeobacter marinintestinus]|uniref:flavin-containing monooxygenase n=1 Tax=Falsiphaeobacter marinintestinus TaxID=1492905 RepID=UPI0011B517B9|nr:NAD(P)/FAD-dependent oxidoreductase [Phaeobacter marinintestinus]